MQTEHFVIDEIDFDINPDSRTLRRRPSDGRLHVGVSGSAEVLAQLDSAGIDPIWTISPPVLNIEGVDYKFGDDGTVFTDPTLDPGNRISEVYVYVWAHRKITNYNVQAGNGWVSASGSVWGILDRPLHFDVAFTCDAAKNLGAF